MFGDKGYVSGEREEAFRAQGKVWGVMRKAPNGGKLHPKNVLHTLRRLGCVDKLGEANLHAHKGEAIREAVADADDAICARCHLRVYAECAGKPGPGSAGDDQAG